MIGRFGEKFTNQHRRACIIFRLVNNIAVRNLNKYNQLAVISECGYLFRRYTTKALFSLLLVDSIHAPLHVVFLVKLFMHMLQVVEFN